MTDGETILTLITVGGIILTWYLSDIKSELKSINKLLRKLLEK